MCQTLIIYLKMLKKIKKSKSRKIKRRESFYLRLLLRRKLTGEGMKEHKSKMPFSQNPFNLTLLRKGVNWF